MANPARLEILEQGVSTWNRWRSYSPETRPDLSDARLTQADLFEADLRRVDLSGA